MPPLPSAPSVHAEASKPPPAEGATLPFAGRCVVLVHPAWHSCGSHQVFVSQAQAYRALGAKVVSVAVADFPGAAAGSRAHRAYLAASQDLIADERHFAGMPRHRLASPQFLLAAEKWLHGNAAEMLCAIARSSDVPAAVRSLPRIDLIHCNHFFCMPAALALRGTRPCKIVLDTHDLQARQFALRAQSGWRLAPRARYDDMLTLELAQMAEADLLVHLNDEEALTLQELLPQKHHELIYPTIKPVPAGPGGPDIIIVASANYPNFLSVAWFLEAVHPLAPEVRVKIIGNIDGAVRARAPALFKEHAGLFLGRVADLDAVYANAAAILLPTTSGHGISVKTIEALSSGVPLIATREAFRGMAIDPAALANVTLLSDAAQFAAAMRRPATAPPAAAHAATDTRRLYERHFAFGAYTGRIAEAIAPLLPADASAD